MIVNHGWIIIHFVILNGNGFLKYSEWNLLPMEIDLNFVSHQIVVVVHGNC